jgi:hypothetical protein
MATSEVVLPVVHPNGTSREELLRLREDAYASLLEAQRSLSAMSPNGRDYYPDPGRMDRALAQHRRRQEALADVLRELEEECLGISALPS